MKRQPNSDDYFLRRLREDARAAGRIWDRRRPGWARIHLLLYQGRKSENPVARMEGALKGVRRPSGFYCVLGFP